MKDNGKTGRGRKTCNFFDELDRVLGHRPATRPQVVVESLEKTREAAQEEAEQETEQ